MTNQNEKKTSGSIGILTILFVVFLVLKLVGVISWSWWWVTAPLWMPLALAVIFATIIVTVKVITRKRKSLSN